MRLTPTTAFTITLLMGALAFTTSGCTKRKSSSSSSVVAPTTSATTGSTTSGTTAGTTSGSGAATNTGTATTATPTMGTPNSGGNTSSGSAASGATPTGFGKGTGQFIDGTSALPVSNSADWGADAGDLDGDGDVDIAIAVNGAASRILWNDGKAGFTIRPTSFPSLVMAATDVRLIDIDNDKDYDLIFSANFEPARIFLNDGVGNFSLHGTVHPTNDAFTYKLAIGDANGDGFSDVFMVQAGQNTASKGQNRLFLNDTNGTYVEAPAGSIPAKNDDSLDATFLDVNADGALDIFVANFGQRPTLLVNDGTGRYVDQSDVYVPPTLSTYATSIAQGDLDNDGDIDLFVGNEGAPGAGSPPPGELNTWLDNKGANVRFDNASSLVPTDAEATWKLRLVDVNADGYLDVVASQLRARQRLYINQKGVLVDATSFLPAVNNTASSSFGLTVGDFNGDQAPDLFFVRRGAQPWLFLNTP